MNLNSKSIKLQYTYIYNNKYNNNVYKYTFSEALGLAKQLASWLTKAGINVAHVEIFPPKRSSLDRYHTVGI